MATASLTFHVPPEGDPDSVISLLEAIDQEKPVLLTTKDLLEFSETYQVGSRTEIQSLATICGLLEKDEREAIVLSDRARAVLRLKPDVRTDVVHFLLYTGWRPEEAEERTILWSYREVCDALWMRSSIGLASLNNVIAEEVRNRITETFQCDPSFGPKSIRGVRKWLEALNPPVIEGKHFSRRHFCAPELALLAIGWVARNTEGEVGFDLLLTPERREQICAMCLLDLSALDRVIDWLLPMYPGVIQPGTSAGVYGRFLTLLKWPELDDLSLT